MNASPPPGVSLVGMIAFIAVAYVFTSFILQKIADKAGTEDSWMAWVPILNLILTVKIAQKPLWWVILFFVPLIGIIALVIVWMGVCENRGKPSWLGILMIVPGVNLLLLLYLAFSD